MRIGKWGWVLGGVAAFAIAAAVLAPRYAIYIPGWVTDWRSPIDANRPITWDTSSGAAASPQAGAGIAGPAERPPNIVLIVADDLGWNDISLNGGGAGGASVPTPNI